jgi:hypothetical protein
MIRWRRRRTRCVCVACSAYGEKGRDHLEVLGVDGRIIFKGTIGSLVVD